MSIINQSGVISDLLLVPGCCVSLMRRTWRVFVLAVFLSGLTFGGEPFAARPTLSLNNPAAKDQDDMCVWIDREHPERSLVICSDKSANAVFVYDLNGALLQQVSVPKPGNIDIRQGVGAPQGAIDLVMVNQRTDGYRLVPFCVDARTRRLEPIPGETMTTGPNYGMCLSRDPESSQLFAFCTSETGTAEQHEIHFADDGKISNRLVRQFPLGKCEGAVADDEQRVVFISEETKGIWKFPLDPADTTAPRLIVGIGEHDIRGDLEGLTIARIAGGMDLLLVSDQGSSRYVALELQAPHRLVGTFSIAGAQDTDGIDVVTTSLGEDFPGGMFLCHTDADPRPVLVTPWVEIASGLRRSNSSGSGAHQP